MAKSEADIFRAAVQTVAGKWGAGTERQRRLAAAGYDYPKVQNVVNHIIGCRSELIEALGATVIADKTRIKEVSINLNDYDGLMLVIQE